VVVYEQVYAYSLKKYLLGSTYRKDALIVLVVKVIQIQFQMRGDIAVTVGYSWANLEKLQTLKTLAVTIKCIHH
jgi:hypothetical protein